MIFDSDLIKGKLIKRYKRFLMDVELENGEIVVAHCGNSGSMKTLISENSIVYLSKNTNPKAKLDYRCELIQNADDDIALVNTSKPNHIVKEAIEQGLITELSDYNNLRTEVKYGENSRIDILLECDNFNIYVEVKNTTMLRENGVGEFPDGVTARGTKHLNELCNMIDEGHKAAMVYLCSRTTIQKFDIAGDIDPKYKEAFIKAKNKGVMILPYLVEINNNEIKVIKKLEEV